ncbi:MAG: endonuclease III [Bacillota bacterium]|jgi:endonuclease-3|nr:endonuclease III [Bacillota bacterium]NLJ02890.1 endonuclease III [Bacillota bacterium]
MKEVLSLLRSMYPEATTALNHKNPFELLVATILSAQCTDERVNIITQDLFPAFPTAHDLAQASFEEVAALIKSAGLWQTKARNLIKTAQILVEKHRGQVPQTREELEALPGVGRKTANVIVANAFQIPAIAVDTHVFRVANRIGLARASNPYQTELQLMEAIPQEDWIDAHHWLIRHGRALCKARNPLCSQCPIAPHCAYFQENLS